MDEKLKIETMTEDEWVADVRAQFDCGEPDLETIAVFVECLARDCSNETKYPSTRRAISSPTCLPRVAPLSSSTPRAVLSLRRWCHSATRAFTDFTANAAPADLSAWHP